MPVHKAEEEAPANLTDKIARESSNSTASDHAIHDETKGAFHTHSSKGPQIPAEMPKHEGTKDELKAKAEEMNK